MGRRALGVQIPLVAVTIAACGADVLVPWGNDDDDPKCRDGCGLEGQTLCERGALSTCEPDKDGCLQWTIPEPCPGGVCLNTVACDPCVHQCSELGPSCGPGGESVRVCERDSNGCRVLRSEVCTETCIAGVCGQFALQQVACGGTFSCQLAATGAVQCWGQDAVGDGSLDEAYTPRDVDDLDYGVTSICAGDTHACAVLDTGEIRCWGRQDTGELGDGSYDIDRLRPVPVIGLGGVATEVSCGAGHTCARLDDGSVRCWGSDSQGQLGDGGLDQNRAQPVVVDFPEPVRHVSAGEFHSCAVTESGAAYCWGNGLGGRLGTGDQTGRTEPTPVNGLSSGVDTIDAGGWHTCALMDNGGVKCWGNDSRGSVGNGEPLGGAQVTPTDVDGLTSGVDILSTGHAHSCVLMLDGGVYCWGDDFFYQLGDDPRDPVNKINQPAPVSVYYDHLKGVPTTISAGRHHTCVLYASGVVGCWGQINGSSGGTDPICFACDDR